MGKFSNSLLTEMKDYLEKSHVPLRIYIDLRMSVK